MSDNSRQMKFDLLTDLSKATKDIEEFGVALDKLREKKLTGNISEGLQAELKAAKNIVNSEGAAINKTLNDIGGDSGKGITRYVTGYKQAISTMVSDIEKYHRLFRETGNTEYQNKAAALIPQVRALNAEYTALNRTLGVNVESAGKLDKAFGSIKNHASWMVSSALIGGAIALPTLAISNMADIEQQMAGMLQTLPQLYKDLPNHIVDQKALNEVTEEFIGIAERYGFEVEKVIEAGKLWSRGYKDVDTVMKLTGNSTKLAIADMMDVALANQAVESVISGYRRQGDAVNFSNHVVDAWTNIAHNAQASATDLAEAMMRTSAAAHMVGVSFDATSALAATMIKNTGQSGAIVGNALKAIFSNIHSEKGIRDLQALGVAVYQFDADGTKHFRNVESVLIDLMTKVQGTKINLEEAMRDVSGGRFQWNRAAALLGDYSEFIKNYGLAISSAGVADKQIMAQLDTISRKAEQVKASLQGLVSGVADAGAARYIKDTLDSIHNFITGLQQIPHEVYTVIGSITKWAMYLYVANAAIRFLDAGLTKLTITKLGNAAATAVETTALAAETVAANTTAASMGRLAVVTTTATGGLNLVAAALIASAVGATIYATNIGEAVNETDKLRQHDEDLLAAKQQQLETLNKQTEFIGTLSNSYVEFQGRLKEVGETTQEGIQVRKAMGATEQELTKLVGEAGLTRLKASNFSQAAIKAEQDTHSKAAVTLKAEMVQINQALDTYTDNQIKATQDRIDSLYRETEALSIWRRAQLAAYDFYAGIMDKQIAFKRFILSAIPSTFSADRAELTHSLDQDIAFRESLRGISRQGVRDDIDAAKAEIANLRKEKIRRAFETYGGGLSDSPPSEVGEFGSGKTGKSSGNGKSTQQLPDHSEDIFRREKGYEVEHMLNEAKIAADQYSQALEILNVKESIFGFSTENSSEKLVLMNHRIMELISSAMEYQELAGEYEKEANDRIASNSVLTEKLKEAKVSWASLSTEEKQRFIQDNSAYLQDEKTLVRLLELSDKLKSASSEAGKSANHLGTELAKLNYDIPKKVYQESVQNNEFDKNHEIAGLGYDATQAQKDIIELKFAAMELYDAQIELNRVTRDYGEASLEYKEAQANVDKLKLKVDELNNKNTDKLKNGVSDMITSWATEGRSFGDIWKSIWREFANDAIKAIFRVQNSAPGLLSSILGFFGGKTVASSGLGFSMNFSDPVPAIPSGAGGFDVPDVSGDIPMFVHKKEMVLPAHIAEAVRKSAINRGTDVVPDISAKTMAKAQAMSEVGYSREHIGKLDEQIGLMKALISVVLNKETGGGTAVAQPIVVTQNMTDDALFAQISKMRQRGYKV